jgi:hypothetical protein
MCLRLYPADEELAGAKEKYAGLREEVRAKVSPEEMAAIDRRVKEHQVGPQPGEPHTAVAGEPDASDPSKATEASKSAAPQVDPGLNEEPRKSSARLPVTISLGVLGLGSVGAGVGLLVDSGNKRKEADDQRERMIDEGLDCSGSNSDSSSCERLDKLVDQADHRRTLGIVFTASGGAVLVGATLLYILWPTPDADAAHMEQDPLQRDGYRRVGAFGLRPEIFAGTQPQDWALGLSGRF